MFTFRYSSLLVLIFCLGLALGSWATPVPPLGQPTMIQADEVLVYPAADWVKTVLPPRFGADQHLILALDERLVTAHVGGCNWVLQVRLNGVPLAERLLQPRLLNKPPSSDLRGTTAAFRLYDSRLGAWNTLFSPDYEHVQMFDADDYQMVWDISDYVKPGERLELRVHYAMPSIPAILKQPAPLALRNVCLGTLTSAEVSRLQEQTLVAGQAWRAVPVAAELPTDSRRGPTAYEIDWAERKQFPAPQVTFTDVRGWTAQALGEAEVSVSASQEQLLWHDRVLKVTSSRVGKGTRLVLRPPYPILINNEWDAANLWLHADQYGNRSTQAEVTAVLQDLEGREFEIGLGKISGGYWTIQHGILLPPQLAVTRFPARLVALVFDRLGVGDSCTLYLDSLTFYSQQRRPYAVSPRPPKPLSPTSADDMLPTPPQGLKCSVSGNERRAIFTCRTARGTLQYEVVPRTGTFDDIRARFSTGNRTVSLTPLAGGGVSFATTTGGKTAGPDCAQLLSSQLVNGVLTTSWRFKFGSVSAPYTLRYQLRGATLVLDVTSSGGAAEGVRFGAVQGLREGRAVEVPYLVMGQKPGPCVAVGDGLFVSCLTDWYNSDYSFSDTAPHSGDEAGIAINGSTRYDTLTNGRRNNLRDRLMVTVSPEFAEVLPNIPNPRSVNHDAAADCTYIMYGGPTPNFWRVLARYGLERVIAMDFGHFWDTINGDGFASRWRPRPGVTEADLASYRQGLEDLGFLFGLLLEYTDYFPVNEFWDENKVSLNNDGNWHSGWMGHYRAKPNAYRFLAEEVGTRIKQRYPTDAVYMDVHTNLGLEAQDYEAGVPGAGMARASVLYNGEGILETQRHGGIVCSEGIDRCLYAGLTDLDYATWSTAAASPSELPLLPDFDLLKIHPLEHGTGMGYNPSAFFSSQEARQLFDDRGEAVAPLEFHQYLAATIAHGHMAILGYGYFPPMSRLLQYYCLLHGLQREYLTDTVSEIQRHDGIKFMSTSEALQSRGLARGRLRVRYSRGLEIYVNYNPKETWEVTVNGRQWLLPPYGWVAEQPGRILACSALVNGSRLDYVSCPDYVYLNSCGEEQTFGGITVRGAVYLQREKTGLRIIPCGDLGSWQSVPTEGFPFWQDRAWPTPPPDRGCSEIRLDLGVLLPDVNPAGLTATARTHDGQTATVKQRRENATLIVAPSADWLDCLLSP